MGPSDFRKNANRLAAELNTCPMNFEILEFRIPDDSQGHHLLKILEGEYPGRKHPLPPASHSGFPAPRNTAATLAAAILRFEREFQENGRHFNFHDCSIGNIVFAGCFLLQGRNFNRGLAAYCAMTGFPKS